MANILETARNAGTFNTLLKAIEAVGLEEELSQAGPLTVFAPVDGAFDQLPEGTLEDLFNDIPQLKKILTYHVVFGDVRSEDLVDIDEARTMEGSVLAVDTSHGYKINQAKVVQPDVMTDNGVIHIIDSVLMPAMMMAK
ncbi:MAG: fasciclin domain-containing protein [Chroococcales cyanobacterium]